MTNQIIKRILKLPQGKILDVSLAKKICRWEIALARLRGNDDTAAYLSQIKAALNRRDYSRCAICGEVCTRGSDRCRVHWKKKLSMQALTE